MILYFSGTGNSAYVAKQLGEKIEDEVINLFEKIRDHDFSEISSNKPWVIVTPTYAWRIPRLLQLWIENTLLTGNKDVYFVMTCGGNIGNAGKYTKKLCDSKGLNYLGCIEVVMPENYIALFSAPDKEEALEIIRQADKVIGKIAPIIKKSEMYLDGPITLKDKLSSGIVNDLFYPLYVHDKKFYPLENCISCGKCVKVCPTKNIHLAEGKPIWNKHCTHCMACINQCPVEAIEYGKHTKGLRRYTYPLNDE